MDEEVKTPSKAQSDEDEENESRESIESLVYDKDFEVFYHPDMTEDIASSSRLTIALVSENQEIS